MLNQNISFSCRGSMKNHKNHRYGYASIDFYSLLLWILNINSGIMCVMHNILRALITNNIFMGVDLTMSNVYINIFQPQNSLQVTKPGVKCNKTNEWMSYYMFTIDLFPNVFFSFFLFTSSIRPSILSIR